MASCPDKGKTFHKPFCFLLSPSLENITHKTWWITACGPKMASDVAYGNGAATV